jgi:hypothetical protein
LVRDIFLQIIFLLPNHNLVFELEGIQYLVLRGPSGNLANKQSLAWGRAWHVTNNNVV